MQAKTIDADEFARRAQQMRGKLYRMAYCYVKNEQDALDIVSEAVYKGYTRRGQLKDPALFDTWLTRIVINCALDHCRVSGRTVPLEDVASFLPASDELPVEERVDLYTALDRLPPDEKTLIILKYFEDKRFLDIATLLGISENTVKTRFYRAMGRLRAQYTEGEAT